MARSRRDPLPGLRLALLVTLLWAGLLVAIPLAALVLRPWSMGIPGVVDSLSSPRVWAAIKLSFCAALGATLLDIPLGLLVAWVLVRERFAGRRIMDALVDIPLALPTAVAGIALTALYAPNGWIGSLLARVGITVAFGRAGIVLALMFVAFPFVVRSVQPVLSDLPREVEEAAATLGATRWQIARRIILPAIGPALFSGYALGAARAVGEYGSVIFIAGNMPGWSEIAPLLIVIRLEQFDYAGAAALGMAMLALSAVVLGAISLARHRIWPVWP